MNHVYGLVGYPLGHSFSRSFFHAKFEREGIAATYENFEMPDLSTLRQLIADRRELCGLNVTIPYKTEVIALLDELDPQARAIGAVNVIQITRQPDGRVWLKGYNSDIIGFTQSIAPLIDEGMQRALILGTGGASKAVYAGLKSLHIEPAFVSRQRRGDIIGYDDLTPERMASHRIIVNTTPVGMYPNVGVSALDITSMPGLEAVIDVIYNPDKTELILRAEEAGVPVAVGGLEMLVAQAVYAAEHFTGQKLPEAVIADTHRKLKRDLSNVAIIGMPGCGKSTIGRALAKTLGKTYVDLDEVIEKNTGMPIPDIFAREGEASFRKYESQAVAEISKQTRQVIACGGGVIKTPGNARTLRQNGPVLWVQRPVERLATGGRPLSTGLDALRKMEAERMPLYRAASDAAVDNTGRLENTVENAVQAFETTFDA